MLQSSINRSPKTFVLLRNVNELYSCVSESVIPCKYALFTLIS